MRFVTCFADKVLDRYHLRETANQFGFELEQSDPTFLARLFNDFEDVATLDHRWLAESFQSLDDKGSGAPKHLFFYIHTKTLLVYQYGKQNVLRGQFAVELDGLSLGLEEKWRMFWIPRRELQNMRVGETKIIWIDTFGFSMGLGLLGFEVQVKGRDPIQSPPTHSDTDALGVAMGIRARLAITRRY
jgi:hypothetical protein